MVAGAQRRIVVANIKRRANTVGAFPGRRDIALMAQSGAQGAKSSRCRQLSNLPSDGLQGQPIKLWH